MSTQDDFVATYGPIAQHVADSTGLDPHLVMAQIAQETGWGKSAPGNNLFGIKGGDGPALQTTEYNPADGKAYATKAPFRSYASPMDSANDYINFMKSNPRYAPVLQAQGLGAQAAALGASGYATDPKYGQILASIGQSLGGKVGGQGVGASASDASGVNPLLAIRQAGQGGVPSAPASSWIPPAPPSGVTSSPSTSKILALAALSGIAKGWQAIPVDYDPWSVMPKNLGGA